MRVRGWDFARELATPSPRCQADSVRLALPTTVLTGLLWVAAACADPASLPPGHGGQDHPIGDDTSEPEDTDTGSDGPPVDADDGCDPYGAPSGCDPSEKCSFFTNECEPLGGSAAQDEACTIANPSPQVDDCAEGLVCVYDDLASPRCLAGCDPGAEPSPCGADRACGAWNGGGPEGVCFQSCDPIAGQCDLAGDSCYPVAQGADLIAACQPSAGLGTEGEACQAANECVPGSACVDGAALLACAAGTGLCCTPLCELQSLPCAGANLTCATLGIEGHEDVGYCRN